jgi:hypothetical protein
MTHSAVRRGRAILFGSAIAIACVSGLPLVAGAVGLSSPVGNCSEVGSNSVEICSLTGTAFPTGAPSTGAGGASHSTNGDLIAGGGLALAGAVGAMGLAIRRRPAGHADDE